MPEHEAFEKKTEIPNALQGEPTRARLGVLVRFDHYAVGHQLWIRSNVQERRLSLGKLILFNASDRATVLPEVSTNFRTELLLDIPPSNSNSSSYSFSVLTR